LPVSEGWTIIAAMPGSTVAAQRPGGLLVYGANGYTGALVARRVADRGLAPVLAGRSEARVAPLAATLGLPHRTMPLDDRAALAHGLAGARAVLHCAGPFSRTAIPMARACLAAGVHYLDITREGPVFEALAGLDAEARSAGVTLLPGVGFDVVPTDCLAAMLSARLPGARSLTLAFQPRGGISRGTALTALEGLGRGGMVRRGGRLTPVPAAWRTRTIDLGAGSRRCITVPWGDVWTAWHSTGIPDVEVYLAAPAALRRVAVATRLFGPLLRAGPAQALLAALVRRRVSGPDGSTLAEGSALVWGEVVGADGQRAEARLVTPEPYALASSPTQSNQR
jgi:short subunit dehydrogenase-like uncharacterized protein